MLFRSPEEFPLFGSLGAEVHHSRWFIDHLPADGSVRFEVLGLGLTGLAVAGPNARALLQPLTDTDLSPEAFRFMDVRRIDVGMVPVIAPASATRASSAGSSGWRRTTSGPSSTS